jgi:hypothetical protein
MGVCPGDEVYILIAKEKPDETSGVARPVARVYLTCKAVLSRRRSSEKRTSETGATVSREHVCGRPRPKWSREPIPL